MRLQREQPVEEPGADPVPLPIRSHVQLADLEVRRVEPLRPQLVVEALGDTIGPPLTVVAAVAVREPDDLAVLARHEEGEVAARRVPRDRLVAPDERRQRVPVELEGAAVHLVERVEQLAFERLGHDRLEHDRSCVQAHARD